jgi:hypothetical protein
MAVLAAITAPIGTSACGDDPVPPDPADYQACVANDRCVLVSLGSCCAHDGGCARHVAISSSQEERFRRGVAHDWSEECNDDDRMCPAVGCTRPNAAGSCVDGRCVP